MLAFVDHMFEYVPEEQKRARLELEKAEAIYNNACKELAAEKEVLKELQSIYTEARCRNTSFSDDDNSDDEEEGESYSSFRRQNIDDCENEAKDIVRLFEVEKDEAEKRFKKAKKIFNSMNRERGWYDMPLLQKLFEVIFDSRGIYKSVYHGGDMEGRHIRHLLELWDEIVRDFAKYLKEIPRNQRNHPHCTDEMIDAVCEAHSRMFGYYDIMASITRMPMGTATDEDLKMLEKASVYARNLALKLFD